MNEQSTALWNPKQERLAALIAAGKSIKAAAAAVESGERTAHTWLEDPRYRALVAELRNRMLNEAVGRMADLTNKAVGTLSELLDDSNGSVRLRAALGIIDAMIRLREHVDFDNRLLRMEQSTANEGTEPMKRIIIPDVDGRYCKRTPPHEGPED